MHVGGRGSLTNALDVRRSRQEGTALDSLEGELGLELPVLITKEAVLSLQVGIALLVAALHDVDDGIHVALTLRESRQKRLKARLTSSSIAGRASLVAWRRSDILVSQAGSVEHVQRPDAARIVHLTTKRRLQLHIQTSIVEHLASSKRMLLHSVFETEWTCVEVTKDARILCVHVPLALGPARLAGEVLAVVARCACASTVGVGVDQVDLIHQFAHVLDTRSHSIGSVILLSGEWSCEETADIQAPHLLKIECRLSLRILLAPRRASHACRTDGASDLLSGARVTLSALRACLCRQLRHVVIGCLWKESRLDWLEAAAVVSEEIAQLVR